MITTVPPTSSTRSITTGDSCGNRTRQLHSPATTPETTTPGYCRHAHYRGRLGFTESGPESSSVEDDTLKRRAADVLAYFDRPGTSNGPTEAINGRLEHLRGSALGFRNLTNYIARSLLEIGGFRPRLHPNLALSR